MNLLSDGRLPNASSSLPGVFLSLPSDSSDDSQPLRLPCGITAVLACFIVPFLTYGFTTLRSRVTLASHDISEPPTLPYMLPGIGNALGFLFRGTEYLARQIL